VPPKLSVALVIAVMGAFVYVLGFVLPRGIWEFSRNVSGYHKQLVQYAGDLADWLRDQDIDVPKGLLESTVSFDSAQIAGLVRGLAGLAGRIATNVVLDVIVVAFLLAELPSLPRTVRNLPLMTETRLAVLTRFSRDVRHYMAIKTAISAITGLVIWSGLKILRVDSPVLLGFTAFLFNFIPGIGSVIASVPGILLALNGGTATAVWTAALYLGANQVLGNIIEPRIMGRGFGVSPAIVLLSVLFWGWVLGPVGMFFAVPLTLAVRGTLVGSRVSPPSRNQL
jgi:predicted PurR-regulated permease PerM